MKFIFTDGACIKNGKPEAKASYAFICENHNSCGLVKPCKYILSEQNEILLDETVNIIPTNNRGELLSIIHAMIFINQSESLKFTIYSDSLICIKTINIWYENRKKKNTLNEFKNLDLLTILMELKEKIKKQNKNVEYIHVKSHQKKPINECIIWQGNYDVDKLATSILRC
jgi:ribonuclease HI